MPDKPPSFLASLLQSRRSVAYSHACCSRRLDFKAGGMAGTAVDVSLYPLDTIKTRLQASEGFLKAGGVKGVYQGLSVTVAGSAPGAALFFSSYEAAKHKLGSESPLSQMAAASIGETVACLVRVPTENVKQKMQAGLHSTVKETVQAILKASGHRGFYTGYFTTVMREVPFAFIQFPLYEQFKVSWARQRGGTIESFEAALCGSVSGAVAAALTTPIDVVKTRLMLGKDKAGVKYTGLTSTFTRIYTEEGGRALLSGLTPRVTWIGIGGFVFFGVYETSKKQLMGAGV